MSLPGLTELLVVGLVAVLTLLLLPVLIIVVIVRAVMGGGARRRGRELEVEEARVMQEIYHGLSRMEQRIEALETILLDKEKKEGGK